MVVSEAEGVFLGAIILGIIHGIEPGHGWPIAASYALDKSQKWLHGFAASFLLGFGHLVSSIAMVLVFFWAKDFFGLTQLGWMNYVAGVLLIALGIREYRHGRAERADEGEQTHDHSHTHTTELDGDSGSDQLARSLKFQIDPTVSHSHETHHSHDGGHTHSHGGSSIFGRILSVLPFVNRYAKTHDHPDEHEAVDRGLLGIAGFAFALGFAHEEEFEIIALCAGSDYCLELMTVYALTVIISIIALTMVLIAGYTHYEERVERYAKYLPTFSAVVLIVMGIGFLVGVF
ncbi:hypothetical protein [Haladaptatus sp. DJG-WS-42]|uniref:hypothetical protein n=1 Tax=Haladaptatus sp. DJG-WS-42 TaxID=3120516 RepID=UPI0030CC81F1